MPALQSIFVKAYWSLVGLGVVWAVFILSLCVPWVQRQYVRCVFLGLCIGGIGDEVDADDDVFDRALYAHKFHTGFWHNVSNPEEFGFASKCSFFTMM